VLLTGRHVNAPKQQPWASVMRFFSFSVLRFQMGSMRSSQESAIPPHHFTSLILGCLPDS
jgi:hypothetical protein